MVILAAAVAVVGALCLLDLLLTFGVIRRLREHAGQLGSAAVPDLPVSGLIMGERVAAFSARTLDGQLLTGAAGLRVTGFFSSSCSVCPERVGPFTEYIAGHRMPRESVLSVVVAPEGRLPSYLGRLGEAGQVCVVQHDSGLLRAFKVAGFPSFCLLDADGAVLAASYDPARLPAAAGAA